MPAIHTTLANDTDNGKDMSLMSYGTVNSVVGLFLTFYNGLMVYYGPFNFT